jgi:lipopolysaccharide transport system ATP-binding protein
MRVVEVQGLSKKFFLRHESGQRYQSLRDTISSGVKGLLGRGNGRHAAQQEEFWALKDLSFNVEQGARVGIIGRNGAGKSTLLKILSKITEPTSGIVRIKGRVASLLEVGTGFHPELTGRENIFLNGAILGMSRVEIRKKFDEIVAFAEIERFLDTPVKRYSSGMYVRLAFAVAAHLEPEILVVDEVLAVGDAEFQKKCLGKMEQVSQGEGRTIIFVSHNMAAVKSLCRQGIVLERGAMAYTGPTAEAVAYYLKGGSEAFNKRTFENEFDREYMTIHAIGLNPKDKSSDEALDEYQTIEIQASITIKKDANRLHLVFVLNNEGGETLFTFSHLSAGQKLQAGQNHLVCTFPKGFLNIGTYYLAVYLILDGKETVFVEKDIITFNVQVGERELGSWMGREPGFIKPVFDWKVTAIH